MKFDSLLAFFFSLLMLSTAFGSLLAKFRITSFSSSLIKSLLAYVIFLLCLLFYVAVNVSVPVSPVSNLDIFLGATTALFLIFSVFASALGYVSRRGYQFSIERVYFQFMIFASAIGSCLSAEPLWLLLMFELASIATVGLIAFQNTPQAMSAALTYLYYSAVAALLFSFGFTDIKPSTLVELMHILTNEGLPFSVEAARLCVAVALCIKLGLGPFSRYLVEAQAVAGYGDFVFMSTVGKLPYLLIFYQLQQYFLSPITQAVLLPVLLIYAGIVSCQMVVERDTRRFFALGGLFNTALAVFLLLAAVFKILFVIFVFYYLGIGLMTYVSYSFTTLIHRDSHYVLEEPRTTAEISAFVKPSSRLLFWLMLTLSSGLPPLGIFIAKAAALGYIQPVEDFSTTSYLLGLAVLVVSSLNMFAYFRQMSLSLLSAPYVAAHFTADRGPVSEFPTFSHRDWYMLFFQYYLVLVLLFPMYFTFIWVIVS